MLIQEDRLSELYLIDGINNSLLEEFTDGYIKLDTNGNYDEFGPLRALGNHIELDSIFDYENVQEIRSKLNSNSEENWKQSKFRPDLIVISESNSQLKKNEDIGLLKISKPLVFGSGKYAIIGYSSKAGSFDAHGQVYTLLYQKFKDNWKLISRFPF